MSQTPSVSSLSRAQQILIGASLLLFIDLFFPWNKFCADIGTGDFCVSANGWHRFGLLAGVLAIVIVVLEGLAAMGNDVLKGSNKGTIILSLAVAYGGWLRYQEAPSTGAGTTTTTPPPAS